MSSSSDPPPPPPPTHVAFFDFDHSLIEENSDFEIMYHFFGGKEGTRAQLMALKDEEGESLQFTDQMDAVFGILNAQGITQDQIIHYLQNSMKLDKDMIGMLDDFDAATGTGGRKVIVSDANSILIDNILTGQDLNSRFNAIYTNPAHWEANGRMRVNWYQSKWDSPVDCDLCSVNICKGRIVKQYLSTHKAQGAKALYLGDGGGDVHGVLSLKKGDLALVRSGYPLEKKLNKQPSAVKATMVSWTTPAEVRAAVAAWLK